MAIWAGEIKIHELYTAGCGLYTIWLVLRAATIVYTWIPQGFSAVLGRIHEWTLLGLKSIVAASLLLGVVPLLLGLLVDIVLVVPYRVQLDQSPVFFLWQVRRQTLLLAFLIFRIICHRHRNRCLDFAFNRFIDHRLYTTLTSMCEDVSKYSVTLHVERVWQQPRVVNSRQCQTRQFFCPLQCKLAI